MNSGQKLNKNSAIIRKLQQLQKEAPPPPPPKPQPKPEEPKPPPPPPEPEPEPEPQPQPIPEPIPEENEFYDEECKKAEEEAAKSPVREGKMGKLKSVMERLSASVQELKNRYDEAELEEILLKKRNRKKEAEAEAYIRSQQQQKREAKRKLAKLRKAQEARQAQQEAAAAAKEAAEKAEREKAEREKAAKEKADKEKEKKEQAAREEKARLMLQKYEGEPLFQVYEKKQIAKDNKEKEMQRAYLQKRALQFKPVAYEELAAHVHEQQQRSRDASQVKLQQKAEQQEAIAQQNLKLLEKIHRGKTYEMVQQEIEERERQKQLRRLHRQRMKEYQQYVRENFLPQPREDEEDEEEGAGAGGQSRVEEEDEEKKEDEDAYPKVRKIKRYKFLQGKSCGQIMQTVKVPMSQRLQRRVGDGYLEHVYSLPKKKKQQTTAEVTESQSAGSASRTKEGVPRAPRPKHFSVELSEAAGRGEITTVLLQLKGRDEQMEMKQKYLQKVAGDRQRYEHVQRDIGDNLVQNIERKLSLLRQL